MTERDIAFFKSKKNSCTIIDNADFDGASEKIWTSGLCITNALLYQLSYIGTIATVWRFLRAGATIGPDAKRRKNQAFEKY